MGGADGGARVVSASLHGSGASRGAVRLGARLECLRLGQEPFRFQPLLRGLRGGAVALAVLPIYFPVGLVDLSGRGRQGEPQRQQLGAVLLLEAPQDARPDLVE